MKLLILLTVILVFTACGTKVEPWTGIVEYPEVLNGFSTRKIEKGQFQSFGDCEHAMRTEAASMEPFSLKQENGHMWRLVWLKCIQHYSDTNKADAEIIVETRGERYLKPK